MTLRQVLNLVLPPLMWLCSSIDQVMEQARSPSALADAYPSLLVPSGIAFAIWLPIFVLCISYGIIQALPKQRENPVFRAIRGWTIAGFAGVCLWGLTNAFWPLNSVHIATGIIFIPTMLILVKTMFVFDAARRAESDMQWISFAGISMIAGWCSIAAFLNWAPQVTTGLSGLGISAPIAGSLILAISLIWIGIVTFKSQGNIAYVFPPIWGLSWLIVKRFNNEPVYNEIIVTASLGVGILALTTAVSRLRKSA